MHSSLKSPIFPVLAILALSQIFMAGPAVASGRDCLAEMDPAVSKTVTIDGGQSVQTAGNPAGPAVVVLRNPNSAGSPLPPLLAGLGGRFHLILPEQRLFAEQPDTGGTGRENCPDPAVSAIEAFLDREGIGSFSLLLTPKTAQTARRLLHRAPDRIEAVIVKGLQTRQTPDFPVWAPLKSYWSDQEVGRASHMRAYLDVEGGKWQFTVSMSNQNTDDGDFWCAQFLLQPTSEKEAQLAAILGLAQGEPELARWSNAGKEDLPPALVIWNEAPLKSATMETQARAIPAAYSGRERAVSRKSDPHQAFATRKLITFLDRATSR
jgi:pimeloyl-ACP methyl ester carboxylesterase